MLQHWVLIQLKKGVTAGDLANLCKCVDSLPEKIPGVICASAGSELYTLVDRRKHDLGILILFQDERALNTYLSHPYHRYMADNYVHPIKKGNLQVFDCSIQE